MADTALVSDVAPFEPPPAVRTMRRLIREWAGASAPVNRLLYSLATYAAQWDARLLFRGALGDYAYDRLSRHFTVTFDAMLSAAWKEVCAALTDAQLRRLALAIVDAGFTHVPARLLDDATRARLGVRTWPTGDDNE